MSGSVDEAKYNTHLHWITLCKARVFGRSVSRGEGVLEEQQCRRLAEINEFPKSAKIILTYLGSHKAIEIPTEQR